MASSRVQQWALTLSAYNYSIVFRPGKLQGNADALSRLPLPVSPSELPIPGDTVLLLEALDLSEEPISASTIKSLTNKDPILSRVRGMVQHGTWSSASSEDPTFRPFKQHDLELSVQDGCILWGNRVVVPEAAREAVIKILHDAHPGITRMKSLARGVVWWPGIDKDLEANCAEETLEDKSGCMKSRCDIGLRPNNNSAGEIPVLSSKVSSARTAETEQSTASSVVTEKAPSRCSSCSKKLCICDIFFSVEGEVL